MKIPDKAFDITMSKPYLNDANILAVDVKCKPNDKFIKHLKLMKHKKFRIAKKNAKKLAELLDAKFYKAKNNKWVVEVQE